MEIPEAQRNDVVSFMTDIEQVPVVPDQVARVIIDEQSGVIVMGESVHINTVAIAQGNLTIKVSETPQVSQPMPCLQAERHRLFNVPISVLMKAKATNWRCCKAASVCRTWCRAQRAWHRPARYDSDFAIDQGCWRPSSRSGDFIMIDSISSINDIAATANWARRRRWLLRR